MLLIRLRKILAVKLSILLLKTRYTMTTLLITIVINVHCKPLTPAFKFFKRLEISKGKIV